MRQVASLTTIVPGSASDCTRAAMFGVSPCARYSRWGPTIPTTTRPVCTRRAPGAARRAAPAAPARRAHLAQDVEPATDGPPRVVLVGAREPEVDDDAVAEKLAYVPIVMRDRLRRKRAGSRRGGREGPPGRGTATARSDPTTSQKSTVICCRRSTASGARDSSSRALPQPAQKRAESMLTKPHDKHVTARSPARGSPTEMPATAPAHAGGSRAPGPTRSPGSGPASGTTSSDAAWVGPSSLRPVKNYMPRNSSSFADLDVRAGEMQEACDGSSFPGGPASCQVDEAGCLIPASRLPRLNRVPRHGCGHPAGQDGRWSHRAPPDCGRRARAGGRRRHRADRRALERRSDHLRDELDRDNHAVDEERGDEQPSRDAMVRNAGVPGCRRRDDETSGYGRAT